MCDVGRRKEITPSLSERQPDETGLGEWESVGNDRGLVRGWRVGRLDLSLLVIRHFRIRGRVEMN